MVITIPDNDPFLFKTLPGFSVLTTLAISWRQLSSGNWVATDRTSASDTYEARVSIYGREAVIDNFITKIYDNRIIGNSQINLSSFADTEKIFGENVDHSGSYTATILQMPEKKQGTFKGFGLTDIYIRLVGTPTFMEGSEFSLINYEPGGQQDANYTQNKLDSYTGAMSYIDHRSDSGIFDAVFTLTNADFVKLRNYIRLTRSGTMTLADTFGVDYPFGPRTDNSYPFSVKLIEWEDMGWFGLKYNKIRLRFAEVL